jgi:4-hydroxyproline epimerase
MNLEDGMPWWVLCFVNLMTNHVTPELFSLTMSGYLGMCGHGTIGLAVTLYEMGRVGLGTLRLETPVGIVEVELHSANRASILNVPSYRYKKSVQVEVAGVGKVTGDIAWGGNWFFLVEDSPLRLDSKKLKN